jgi:hypothetical protein
MLAAFRMDAGSAQTRSRLWAPSAAAEWWGVMDPDHRQTERWAHGHQTGTGMALPGMDAGPMLATDGLCRLADARAAGADCMDVSWVSGPLKRRPACPPVTMDGDRSSQGRGQRSINHKP